jgi:hypothetical protein
MQPPMQPMQPPMQPYMPPMQPMQPPMQPQAGVGLLITCGGKSLERKDLGGIGKSDPFLVIYLDDGRTSARDVERPSPLWKTEVITSSSNPRWTSFPLFFDMIPGGLQGRLLVECYDWDADGGMDLIGEFRCTLQQLTDQRLKQYFINPKKKSPLYKNSGSFVLYSATPVMQRDPIYAPCAGYNISFCAKNLDRKDLNTLSSDPFIVVKAKTIGGSAGITQQINTMTMGHQAASTSGPVDSYVVVAKTPHLKANLNPSFPPVFIDIAEVGGFGQKFIVEVYDWDGDQGHDLIGSTILSFQDVLYASKPTWLILNPSKVGDLLYRNSGTLFLAGIQPVMTPKVYSDAYTFQISCRNLDRKDMLTGGKSDPYIKIMGKPKPEWSFPMHWDPQGEAMLRVNDKERVQVHRTETFFNELNPNYAPFTLNVPDCGGLDTKLNLWLLIMMLVDLMI